MPVTLTASEDANTVRITVSLDEASSAPVALAIDARMNVSNATFAGQQQIAQGAFDPTDALQDGAGFFATEATFSGPLVEGQELFSYDFAKTGPGGISITSYIVLIDEGPGSLSEAADLLSFTFDGGTMEGATPGDDILSGSPASETILALAGDDIITASGGNDNIDGGEGLDTLVLNGPRDNYTVIISPTQISVTERGNRSDDTNILTDIETLVFEGSAAADPLDLTKFGGAATLTGPEFETIIELYIAYFDRAPDALGLNFWSTAFADGLSLDEMANLFATQPETMMTYPDGTSSSDFVTSVYSNVLGRSPDALGFDFWVGQLDSGGSSRAQFILRLLEGAKAAAPADASADFLAQQAADQAYLDSKTDVGAFYSVHLGLSDVEDARAVMQAFGAADMTNEIGARNLADDFAVEASTEGTDAFLMPVVGVIVDDFSGLL